MANVEFRKRLPYGMWKCDGGREVLFDRRYHPVCERMNGGPSLISDPKEWVKGVVSHDWFYNDATPEKQKMKAATDKLREWGVEVEVAANR